MTGLLRRCAKYLASRRFATAVICAWAIAIILWVLGFQVYGLPIGQIRAIVYGELFFRLIYSLLLLSTVGCILPRIPKVVRRATRMPSAESTPRVPKTHALEARAEWDPAEVAGALRRAGFRRLVEGEGWVWGVRNRWSPLGNLLFHLAIVIVAIGVLVMGSEGASYAGSAVVAVGETIDVAAGDLVDVETPDVTSPNVAFTLTDVESAFYEDILLFTKLRAHIVDAEGRSHTVTLPRPWMPDWSTMVAVEDFGYTITVASVESTALVEPVVYKLRAFPSGTQDSFDHAVAGTDYRFSVRIYGDYVDRDGVPGTRSFNLKDPRIWIECSRILSTGETAAVSSPQLLAAGDAVHTPTGDVIVQEVGNYGKFRITRWRAAPLILLAAAMFALGALLRLILPRVEVVALGHDGGITFSVLDETYRISHRTERRVLEELDPVQAGPARGEKTT